MTRPLSLLVVGCAVLAAMPAEARFGKKSPPPEKSPEASTTHEAEAVPSNNNNYNGGSSHSGGSYRPSGRYGPGRGHVRYRNRHYGYWPGVYAPGFAVGYYAVAPQPQVVVAPQVEEQEQPEVGQQGVRLSAGIEGQGFRNGVTVGALVGVEGERWGFFASGQNIAVYADDGRNAFDHLQVVTAHGSFAFLTGRYGRLRFEAGADAVFAPDLIVVGPTAGFSGTLWIGGPFAIEGSAMVTPWPYRQFDGKVGLALGLGPFGLRAGVRAQLLDDRGLVDGVIHQDAFVGPYVGLSLVF